MAARSAAGSAWGGRTPWSGASPRAAPSAVAKIAAAPATASVDGASSARPSSAAIDADTRPGIPHGSMSSKSASADVHVERDAVVGDAPLDPDPQGADLARARAVRVGPAARVAVTSSCLDAECRTRPAHRGLEGADVGTEQERPVGEPEDRVRDELAGAVVRDLAAALDAQQLDAAGFEVGRRGEHVRRLGLASEREHRRVLQEEQLVPDAALGAGGREALLEVPRVAVRDAAEPVDGDGSGGVGRAVQRLHRRGRDRTLLHGRTIAGGPAPTRGSSHVAASRGSLMRPSSAGSPASVSTAPPAPRRVSLALVAGLLVFATGVAVFVGTRIAGGSVAVATAAPSEVAIATPVPATPTPEPTATPDPTPTPTPAPSLEQLIGQKLVVRMEGRSPSAALLERARKGEIGGVVLYGFNVRSEQQLAAATRRAPGGRG